VPLLGEHLQEQWLPAIEHTVRRSTFVSYRSHVLGHIVPLLGSASLVELDARDLNRFYAQLLAEGRKKGPGGLSPTTGERTDGTLSSSLTPTGRASIPTGCRGDSPG
jgi:hypothetical protein